MPPSLSAPDGMVCFRANPLNPAAAAVNACLAYGNYQGPGELDTCGNPLGAPAPALPVAENEPALANLENTCLLRMGHQRGLFLENVDGFASAPVFRNSPHLLNLVAPYGLSGHVAQLDDFAAGAVGAQIDASTPATLTRLMEAAGFRVDAIERFGLVPNNAGRLVTALLAPLDRAIGRARWFAPLATRLSALATRP